MKNPFEQQADLNNRIDRDPFDWTHANNFTAKLGYIYPIFRRLMPPNSKLTISPDLGLQFMPMSFPVQTPMKCKVSFYKVPLRTLWKDYMDYVGNFKQGLEEPYHDIKTKDFDKFYGECQLADYLDIPNILYGTFGSKLTEDQSIQLHANTSTLLPFVCVSSDSDAITEPSIGDTLFYDPNYTPVTSVEGDILRIPYGRLYNLSQPLIQGQKYIIKDFQEQPILIPADFIQGIDIENLYTLRTAYLLNSRNQIVDVCQQPVDCVSYRIPDGGFPWYPEGTAIENSRIVEDNNDYEFVFTRNATEGTKILLGYTLYFSGNNDIINRFVHNYVYSSTYIANPKIYSSSYAAMLEGDNANAQYSVITPETTPYYGKYYNPEGQKLSAYSARAYEAIYNAYIRDPRNNPLLDENNQPVYNHWLLNYEGGADDTLYQLRRDNWEADFLTTAVQSPQQGVAPLVGLTQYVTQNDDQLSYNLALVDEDGKRYSVNYELAEDNGTKSYTISVGDELPDGTNMLQMTPKQLMDSQTMGFSIPDLRIVNAYQKYLELNIRKSFSYKDIIQGRFDCKVRFDELQMPEFLGGFTRDIQMNRVVQSVDNNIGTTPTYEGSLGSLGGDAYLNNPQSPSISVFCDEECIVMGLIRIVPQPVYSQLLPKDYLYRDILDHFNPEFNNLGMQPITYGEVCPLQCKMFGVSPTDTFGYQRAWYEYVMCNDTSHGLLRTTHRDFLMNRHFKEVPRLNESFLLVDDKQLNDVFTVQDDSDKIVGQAVFKCTTELPINRVQIPRLD